MRKIHKVNDSSLFYQNYVQAGIMECDECGRKVLDLKRHKEILHKYVLFLFALSPQRSIGD